MTQPLIQSCLGLITQQNREKNIDSDAKIDVSSQGHTTESMSIDQQSSTLTSMS